MTIETLQVMKPRAKPETPSIIYGTPWKRLNDGWAVAARQYALAMHDAGVHINMLDTINQSEQLDSEVRAEMAPILDAPFNPILDYYLYSGVLMGWDKMKRIVESFSKQPVIVGYHCFFERLVIEEQLINALKSTSVLTTSRLNCAILKEHGLSNVTRIPYPWRDSDPLRNIPPSKSSSRFYWIGRFEPRKAPDRLIRAFMRSFDPGEAHLTMKLSSYAMPGFDQSPEGVILDEMSSSSTNNWGNGYRWNVHNWKDGITLIRDKLSLSGMLNLHAANDIYVSPSFGEGLELGAWAAKQAARRIVATDSGGPFDYMSENDIRVDGPLMHKQPSHSCYDELWGQSFYNDYDLNKLAVALSEARIGGVLGEREWPGHEEHKSDAVGRKLKEWILERI